MTIHRDPSDGGSGPIRRLACWTDDAGAMPLAMLVTLVGVMLSALLVSMTAAQTGATRFEVQRTTALHAAQSGIDVAWARLGRVANRSALPCGPLTGSVLPAGHSPAGEDATFEVLIDYFSEDPQAVKDSDFPPQAPTPPSGWIACVPGIGTTSTPDFALMRSTGRDSTGTKRAVRATYSIRIKHVNIVGGLIHRYQTATGPHLCLDAGSASPPNGTVLRAKAVGCDAAVPQRKFAYNQDLTLSLPSSKRADRPRGLCLDAGAGNPGDVVRLQPCASPAVEAQQWLYDDYANFMRPGEDVCFAAEGSGADVRVVLEESCPTGGGAPTKWRPEPSVGAGAAGPGSDQLVSFGQFGRCLDLISFKLVQPSGKAVVQAHPCKQAMPGDDVSWNQRWTVPTLPEGTTPVTGKVTVTSDDKKRNGGDLRPHCLTTASTVGGYPTVTPCVDDETGIGWKFYGENASYENKFTIVDIHGRCLAPEPVDPADPSDSRHVQVVECDGSPLQKWNAPPYTKGPQPLKDISER